MIRNIQIILDILLFIVPISLILLAPYSNYDESFNVNALHDIINIGLDKIDSFDHMKYPDMPKKTSLPIIFLSLPAIYIPETCKNISNFLSLLLISINNLLPTSISKLYNKDELSILLTDTKILQLLFVRLLMSIISSFSILSLRKTIDHSCSQNSKFIGVWFSLFYYPLPHMMFYISRFVPHFVCLPLLNFAISMFISGDISRSLIVFTFIGIVFRVEILLFTAVLTIISASGILRIGKPILSFREACVSITISAALSIFLCSRIDSYFWNTSFIIPTFKSALVDIFDGSYSNWGLNDFHIYFTEYYMKIFAPGFEIVYLLTGLFLILSFCNLKRIFGKNVKHNELYNIDYINYGVGTFSTLFWSNIFYVLVLSVNGKKEWKFLIYTISVLCAVGSSTFEWIQSRIEINRFIKKLLVALIILSYVTNLICCFIFGLISSWNYTGGESVQRLNLRIINENKFNNNMLKPIIIHWDEGTCKNGASSFTQISDNKLHKSSWINEVDDNGKGKYHIPKYWIIYDKTNDKVELQSIVNDFDYWVQYENEPMVSLDNGYEWVLIDIIEGQTGLDVNNIYQVLSNPSEIKFQILNAIETRDLTWFKNVIHSFVQKDIRGRIWEKSELHSNNKLNQL